MTSPWPNHPSITHSVSILLLIPCNVLSKLKTFHYRRRYISKVGSYQYVPQCTHWQLNKRFQFHIHSQLRMSCIPGTRAGSAQWKNNGSIVPSKQHTYLSHTAVTIITSARLTTPPRMTRISITCGKVYMPVCIIMMYDAHHCTVNTGGGTYIRVVNSWVQHVSRPIKCTSVSSASGNRYRQASHMMDPPPHTVSPILPTGVPIQLFCDV